MEINKPSEDLRKELWKYFLNLNSDQKQITNSISKISEGLSGADIESISTAARRTAVLSNSKIDIASLVLSIINFREDYKATSMQKTISAADRKKAAIQLVYSYGLSQVEAAACLGVARQTISSYLKELDHAE